MSIAPQNHSWHFLITPPPAPVNLGSASFPELCFSGMSQGWNHTACTPVWLPSLSLPTIFYLLKKPAHRPQFIHFPGKDNWAWFQCGAILIRTAIVVGTWVFVWETFSCHGVVLPRSGITESYGPVPFNPIKNHWVFSRSVLAFPPAVYGVGLTPCAHQHLHIVRCWEFCVLLLFEEIVWGFVFFFFLVCGCFFVLSYSDSCVMAPHRGLILCFLNDLMILSSSCLHVLFIALLQ